MIHQVRETTAAPAIAVRGTASLPHHTAAAGVKTSGDGETLDFASILGATSAESNPVLKASPREPVSSMAAAPGYRGATVSQAAAAAAAAAAASAATTTTASTSTATTATTPGASASTAAATAAAATTPSTSAAAATPGMAALVNAIQNGTFQVSYVTDPSQLKETTPWGTDTLSSVNYASNQTAAQLAQLLGGKVVQMTAFQDSAGSADPMANYIQLPNGMTFNAADVAYYGSATMPGGPAQLTACLTATINQGAAWTNYQLNGGTEPSFAEGYIGPPVSGMTYPPGTIGANGMVIDPNAPSSGTQGV